MSYGRDDKNGGIERGKFTNSGPKKAADSVHPGRPSIDSDCTVPVENLEIDKKLLIDPKKLYIGSKIGEGAHGKVYEGKTVQLMQFIGACKEPIMVIATELLPGMSLKKYLESIRPKQLDLHLATSFAVDIARALECLHANGIIHRDLKPDNLLLTANQKNVKLVDFGLAREETVTEMMTAETGTYRWMAPELYSTVTLRRGEKKHYTNKVDVYSFGIVLWELLTNRMPFEGMSNLQAAYAAAFKRSCKMDDWPIQLKKLKPEEVTFLNEEFTVKEIEFVVKNLGNNIALEGLKPCNSVYEVAAKVILNRLIPVMPLLISVEHAAFIRGRSISDHILIAQEMFHKFSFKESVLEIKAILVDFSMWTGKKVNKEKSAIIFGNNVGRKSRENLSRIMGFNQ
ncbi:hypothetical protein KFK09_007229 [Dendrobium nobile]|uniref:Protein kinase domain-containing protein n=1 Tax=Dendrobium nobile TaxID=94219 RepID=A0A8T3BRJ4_DENNO|nr:hypothetical protein KFK09_007229 [Dendrobium nobile]